MTTVTVTVSELHWMLAATIPHTDDDELFPMLSCVELRITSQTLTATATDRHTLGHAAVRLIDSKPRAATLLLPVQFARELRNLLRTEIDTSGLATVALTLDEENLVAHLEAGALKRSYAGSIFGPFPDWSKLAARCADAFTTPAPASFAVDPRLLARFTKGSVDGSIGVMATAVPVPGAIGSATPMVAVRIGNPGDARYFFGLIAQLLYRDVMDHSSWAAWAAGLDGARHRTQEQPS
ncbi:MAG: hypothetical protein AB7G36_10070 [Candidatus Nanopelagicales bacterium]